MKVSEKVHISSGRNLGISLPSKLGPMNREQSADEPLLSPFRNQPYSFVVCLVHLHCHSCIFQRVSYLP